MVQSIMARTGGVLVTPSLGLSPSISSQRTACILRRGQTPLLRRQSHSQTRMLAAKVPMVEISFETAEGNQTMSVESGDILRDVMMNPPSGAKVHVYTVWGKVANCGGNGQCGTCIVEVLADPKNLLGERNDTEEGKLRKKPSNYRLACQTNTGDGDNSGAGVVVRTKPK